MQPRLHQPRPSPHWTTARFDFDKLARHRSPRRAHARPRHRHQLLPRPPGRSVSNSKWRPVGLGVMGLQDVFFQLRWAFDAARSSRALDQSIQEEIYYHALSASCDLAEKQRRRTPPSNETRAGSWPLPIRSLGRHAQGHPQRWDALRLRIKHRRPAQFTADRHRSHSHHRVDRRML